MKITKFTQKDVSTLFDMLKEEGGDWSEYFSEKGYPKYLKALQSSITYLVYDAGYLCGFIRCREDDSFGVYIYDLLVRKSRRGNQLGRKLMEQICKDYEGQPIYVMSDVDMYYEKLGYRKEGSIFEVTQLI